MVVILAREVSAACAVEDRPNSAFRADWNGRWDDMSAPAQS